VHDGTPESSPTSPGCTWRSTSASSSCRRTASTSSWPWARSPPTPRFLEVAVASGLNVLVSGGTQADKNTLHTRLKALPWTDVHEATRVHSIGPGRIETRTIRVIDPTGSSDGQGEFFPGAVQAIPGTVAQRPISAHR